MKTVKRKANVGERILITNKVHYEDRYENGAVFEVTGIVTSEAVSVYRKENSRTVIREEEYEVIIEEEVEMVEIKSLGEIVKQLRSCGYTCEAGPLENNVDFQTLERIAGIFSVVMYAGETVIPKPKSPQQIRDEIVAKAKADVDKITLHGLNHFGAEDKVGNFTYNYRKYGVKFVVNKEKRTVVALICSVASDNIHEKGIAKADPSDCFNVHLGEVIALRRALGLEVPAEYYNAPAPTEVRVGDFLKYADLPGVVYEVLSTENKPGNLRIVADKCDEEYRLVGREANGGDFTGDTVIDDSRE